VVPHAMHFLWLMSVLVMVRLSSLVLPRDDVNDDDDEEGDAEEEELAANGLTKDMEWIVKCRLSLLASLGTERCLGGGDEV
jgi:hypothetical protein